MGKTRKPSGDSNEKKKTKQVVEESKVVEEERYQSDLVRLKMENQKIMNKSVSQMESNIKKTLEAKQVITAAKALQKYYKSNQEKGKKNLLQEEDAYVHLNFTLTQVPAKPTPRPLQVKIAKPFNTEKHNSRVCIFVKDPETDFRKQIENMKIPCIAEVIGFDRLKRDFH